LQVQFGRTYPKKEGRISIHWNGNYSRTYETNFGGNEVCSLVGYMSQRFETREYSFD